MHNVSSSWPSLQRIQRCNQVQLPYILTEEDDSESAKHRGRRAEEKQRRKICSVFLTHHKKIQPLLKLLLLEELNNMNFIVPIAASSLRIPLSKPSC
ncbi:hypothetical protein Pcinc_006076 [Petrolisthes cinctipes]|uniref:Uncharacterized protein n=1 Tax=Petrolisthes cinctipes TaxID=88211 RepID=A0AAE1GDN2_PETCI|nr:hypothetical protein Pcinc_006076 [Petrolisthes cinctipes]